MGETDATGTTTVFKPDSSIFLDCQFSFEVLQKRLRELSFLNKGVKIILQEEATDKQVEFLFDGGIVSFVEYLNKGRNVLHDNLIIVHGETIDETSKAVIATAECVLQWSDSYQENIHSYVNNINTIEGGTHLTALKSALTRVINQFAENLGVLKTIKEDGITGEDVREGLTGIISVRIKNPEFQGQTKTKLGNPEVRCWLENLLN